MGSFTVDVSAWCRKAKIDARTVYRAVCLEALRQLVIASPVDTSQYRTSWRTALNQVDLSFQPPIDKTAPGFKVFDPSVPINAGAAIIGKMELSDICYITNNVDYALEIEDGKSRTQAPQGVLHVTVERIVGDLERLVRVSP